MPRDKSHIFVMELSIFDNFFRRSWKELHQMQQQLPGRARPSTRQQTLDLDCLACIFWTQICQAGHNFFAHLGAKDLHVTLLFQCPIWFGA